MGEKGREGGHTHLGNVSGWIEAEGGGLVVEFVAVEIEKVHQQVAQVVLAFHVLALDGWHQLQHADDEADHGEAADAAVDGLVEAAHGQELLDQGDQHGHGRVLLAPPGEGADGGDARHVLKRHVDLEPGLDVDVLDQRHLGLGDVLEVFPVGHLVHAQEVAKLVQHALLVEHRRPVVEKVRRAHDEVHVARRQIQARHEGAEAEELRVGEPLAHGALQLVDQVLAQPLLKLPRLDVVVEIDNLLVQPVMIWV